MPLISPDLVNVAISDVLHPTQKVIEPHIELTSRVIEKLILKRFNIQLSCACTTLMRSLMVEMCDITLFEAQKSGFDSEDPKFTCLTTLIATIMIFHQLLDRNQSVENLVDTTSHDKEDNFDIDEDETEDEITSVRSLSSSNSDSTTSENSTENKAILNNEQSIFAGFLFALMMANKIYYDEKQTYVADAFDMIAGLYKKLTRNLESILAEERKAGYPTWGINRDIYEKGIQQYKKKLLPLNDNDAIILANLGQGLSDSNKRTYNDIVAKMKLLTSLVYYKRDNRYTFTLFQIEINALKVLYNDLNLNFLYNDVHQFLNKAKTFVQSKLSLDNFEHFLRHFGQNQSPVPPHYFKLQYMFNHFKLDNPLRVQSDPLSLSQVAQQEIRGENKPTRRKKIQSS